MVVGGCPLLLLLFVLILCGVATVFRSSNVTGLVSSNVFCCPLLAYGGWCTFTPPLFVCVLCCREILPAEDVNNVVEEVAPVVAKGAGGGKRRGRR